MAFATRRVRRSRRASRAKFASPRASSRDRSRAARAPRLFEFLDVSDLEYEIIDRSGLTQRGLPIGAIQIRPFRAALRSPRVTARRDMSSPAKENPASGDAWRQDAVIGARRGRARDRERDEMRIATTMTTPRLI